MGDDRREGFEGGTTGAGLGATVAGAVGGGAGPSGADLGATVSPVTGEAREMGATSERRRMGDPDATLAPGGSRAGSETRDPELARTLPGGAVQVRLKAGYEDSLGRTLEAAAGGATYVGGATEEGPGVPARLGRYLVIKALGAGGMGVVYKAFDPDLDRKVAVKLLLGQGTPQARTRLLREAQAMAKLSHPNVVPVFDVGMVDDQVFVAMDFVDGQVLSGWMEARHPWREVVELFVQAGRGLAAAHAVGLVHRDFKPKSRRPSQTAPQPTYRPHSHSQGRFEGVAVDRLAPPCSRVPQVLAKRWQRPGPPEDRRGLHAVATFNPY